MNDRLTPDFSERLKTSALAKQALLAQMRPRPTLTDPQRVERSELRAQRLLEVRNERTVAKAAKQQRLAEAKTAELAAQAELEAAALDAKRGLRKERKTLSAAEAKARRDAKYAARKARQ